MATSLVTITYEQLYCGQTSNFKTVMLWLAAAGAALAAILSIHAIGAIRDAIASQVKIKTNLRALHEFLDQSKHESEVKLLKLQKDKIKDSEKGQMGGLFTEMKRRFGEMDDMIKELERDGDSEKEKKDN